MKIHLLIFSGQSNMQGQSEVITPYTVPMESAFEYKQLTNSFEQIRHPSGEDIIINDNYALAAAYLGRCCPMPTFAKAFSDIAGKCCCIHAAKGATTIGEWMKGTFRYAALLEKVNAAKSLLAYSGYEIASCNMVWLQGESDGIQGVTEPVYSARLSRFLDDIRLDLGVEKMLIIRIAKFYDFPCLPIMHAQEELCRTREDFIMLTRAAQSFTIENGLMQGDTAPFHYTAKGYEALGTIAGTNAGKAIMGIPFELEKDEYLV